METDQRVKSRYYVSFHPAPKNMAMGTERFKFKGNLDKCCVLSTMGSEFEKATE